MSDKTVYMEIFLIKTIITSVLAIFMVYCGCDENQSDWRFQLDQNIDHEIHQTFERARVKCKCILSSVNAFKLRFDLNMNEFRQQKGYIHIRNICKR